MALKEVRVERGKLRLLFDLKNEGKFRLKELSHSKIQSTYSRLVKRQELSNTAFYLEWQISYFIGADKEPDVEQILIDRIVRVTKGDVRPYELSGLVKLACDSGLMEKQDLEQIREWACSSNNTLEEYLKDSVFLGTDFELEGMEFKSGYVRLPFCIHENSDGTWIEVILQKQQYAYGFQPMVYFCIPHHLFKREEGLWIWESENASSLVNLLKVFALTSETHRKDICSIIEVLIE